MTTFNVHDNPVLQEIQNDFDEVISNTDRFIQELRDLGNWGHGEDLGTILNVWEIPETDLVLNFTDHLFYPECGLCHRQCENEWGNNGAPLTDQRICNECNDRVIHNRIMVILDRATGPDDDAPDDPE